MGNSSVGADEILRRHVEPALKAAEAALEAAQAASPGDPGLAMALVSTGLLQRFVEKTIERIIGQETAERVAVYQVVAREGGRFLSMPVEAVFPSVLRLCGEQDESLKDDFPVSDTSVIGALRAALLRVTVTYKPQVGEGAERTINIFLLDSRERQVREVESKAVLAWTDVPVDVREQAIRHGQRTVSFTLYSGDSQ